MRTPNPPRLILDELSYIFHDFYYRCNHYQRILPMLHVYPSKSVSLSKVC